MRGEFDFNEWAQNDRRPVHELAQRECQSAKEHETRGWKRTVTVPEGLQPIDLIQKFRGDLPMPPFHALQLTINKNDVECIASAMVNPNLRWRKMYHFTIAPYEGKDPAFKGDWVLISGHHRLLAFLLSGIGPSDDCPLQVSKAPLAMSAFPWTTVIWGK